ncbi:hypothetical protein [Roseiflexus castenholzii]|uniref:Uncharacterized protein n=1 Tax=Roseiflexus castenholzii (strain DSM 13941 / HLO8) TaxID=383372 RepID=A7NQT6_ROSCS|nr:hypothetical protein [Roseiflexus castenholzii]ABU59932.1 conserved hypothetical protein [Roseiflexus castenholzii DSM 13941]
MLVDRLTASDMLPSLRDMRRVAFRAAILFLIWCTAIHAAAACIVHCQIAPWIQQYIVQPLPLLVCDLSERASNAAQQTVSEDILPEVIQPVAPAAMLMIVFVLRMAGIIVTVQINPRHQVQPPLTPPPRGMASSSLQSC